MTASWCDILAGHGIKVHPAADLFPMMSEGELEELAADVRDHGVQIGVALWTPEKTWTRKGPKELYLLDGRNRLEAVTRAITDEEYLEDWIGGLLQWGDSDGAKLLYGDHDPYKYVVSANIRRRHLSAEQKREIIVKLKESSPQLSERAIAEATGASPATVHRAIAALAGASLEAPDPGPEPQKPRTDAPDRESTAKAKVVGRDGKSYPARKKSVPRADKAPSTPASQIRAKAIAGFSTVFHRQLEETLGDLTRIFKDHSERVREIPASKRVALARAFLEAPSVDLDDLGGAR